MYIDLMYIDLIYIDLMLKFILSAALQAPSFDTKGPIASPTSPTQGLVTQSPAPAPAAPSQRAAAPQPSKHGSVQDQVHLPLAAPFVVAHVTCILVYSATVHMLIVLDGNHCKSKHCKAVQLQVHDLSHVCFGMWAFACACALSGAILYITC